MAKRITRQEASSTAYKSMYGGVDTPKPGEGNGILFATNGKEVDPSGIHQHESGAKTDGGKPDTSLLLMFGKALSEVALVGTGGKVKYTRGGWQDVEDGENRYTAAMLRHLFKEHYEEKDTDLREYIDADIYHSAQVAWNALARLELMMRRKTNEQ